MKKPRQHNITQHNTSKRTGITDSVDLLPIPNIVTFRHIIVTPCNPHPQRLCTLSVTM
ncbi:MAG: hypothetical protein P9X24_12645 [Candidatus Hatepunaea meridiana]|nr:hypothetical protein [Candidatus Hatepunaea meridiana]